MGPGLLCLVVERELGEIGSRLQELAGLCREEKRVRRLARPQPLDQAVSLELADPPTHGARVATQRRHELLLRLRPLLTKKLAQELAADLIRQELEDFDVRPGHVPCACLSA